jgi:hypothetical protein
MRKEPEMGKAHEVPGPAEYEQRGYRLYEQIEQAASLLGPVRATELANTLILIADVVMSAERCGVADRGEQTRVNHRRRS